MNMAIALAMKYWREACVAALIGLLVTTCRARDHAIAARALAERDALEADSVLAVTLERSQRQSAAIDHDTILVSRFVTRLDTLRQVRRDTIYLPGDTLRERPMIPLPVAEVAANDSLAPACSALKQDCAAFRVTALERFAGYEKKLAIATRPMSWREKLVWATAGGVLGAVAEHQRH